MTPGPAKRRLDIAGQSPTEDRLLAMIAALASELAVTRERLDTVERLLDLSDGIEAYRPDADATAAREGLRKRLIAKIFRPVREAADQAGRDLKEC